MRSAARAALACGAVVPLLTGCGREASTSKAPEHGAVEIAVPSSSASEGAAAVPSASAATERPLVEGLKQQLTLEGLRTKRAECRLLIDAATANVEEVKEIYGGPGDAAELRAMADAMRRFDGVLAEMNLTLPELIALASDLRASARKVERSARIMASTSVEKTFAEAAASFDEGTHGMGKLGAAINGFCHDAPP